MATGTPPAAGHRRASLKGSVPELPRQSETSAEGVEEPFPSAWFFLPFPSY